MSWGCGDWGWSGAGEGSLFHAGRAKRKGGLTDFGLDLIEMAEDLGIVVDVSHLNDEGFEDVMAVARKPVIASHSNCRALAPVPRNLTDGQISALAEKGGVIGMNALDVFTHQDRHGVNRRTVPVNCFPYEQVRSHPYAGGATSAMEELKAPIPGHAPFGSSLSAPSACSRDDAVQ